MEVGGLDNIATFSFSGTCTSINAFSKVNHAFSIVAFDYDLYINNINGLRGNSKWLIRYRNIIKSSTWI